MLSTIPEIDKENIEARHNSYGAEEQKLEQVHLILLWRIDSDLRAGRFVAFLGHVTSVLLSNFYFNEKNSRVLIFGGGFLWNTP